MTDELRNAVHEAIVRALDEAGVKSEVLRGMCIEVGLDKFADSYRASPEVLRASSGSLSEADGREAFEKWCTNVRKLSVKRMPDGPYHYLETRHAWFSWLESRAALSPSGPMISLDAVAAEPSVEAQGQSTRNTPICPYCNEPAVGWSAAEAKAGRKESPGLTTFHCRMAAD